MTPRWATTAIFAVNGAAVGVWVAQIPWVQERFDLSRSTIGLIILGMSISVILALPFAGQAVVRHGSERMVLVGGVACVLAVNLPILAPAPLLVAAALLVFGGSTATMDVSMNSHGVSVEKALGRPIMSSLHAGWAFGGMGGAGFVALCHALGVEAHLITAIASALLLAALLLAAKPYVFHWMFRRAGERSRQSLEVGVRLGQVSEFSLLIAVVALEAGIFSERAGYLVQVTTLVTFVFSSYLIVMRYPTPIAVRDSLRRD